MQVRERVCVCVLAQVFVVVCNQRSAMLSNWFDQVIIFIFSASDETHAAGTPIRYAFFFSFARSLLFLHSLFFGFNACEGDKNHFWVSHWKGFAGIDRRKAALCVETAYERTVKKRFIATRLVQCARYPKKFKGQLKLVRQRHFAWA